MSRWIPSRPFAGGKSPLERNARPGAVAWQDQEARNHAAWLEGLSEEALCGIARDLVKLPRGNYFDERWNAGRKAAVGRALVQVRNSIR
jgi:hypothetical protein